MKCSGLVSGHSSCVSLLRPQLRALDKMTVERVCAERTECVQRLEQRALQERLEAENRQQASLVQELKSWCLSKLHSMEPGSPPLRRCSPMAEGLDQLPSDQGGAPRPGSSSTAPPPWTPARGGPVWGRTAPPNNTLWFMWRALQMGGRLIVRRVPLRQQLRARLPPCRWCGPRSVMWSVLTCRKRPWTCRMWTRWRPGRGGRDRQSQQPVPGHRAPQQQQD
ncbi:hypothetical protein KUCAC02_020288 [Chaenocephalus aceratus]|uniref:Uncharacterized protein n=1 Tax=Chaenocephalus aceratus TaxID=36190 RepID=A0ACB9VRQ5_CHAAC|nr:hypothetical protein KUCAC02_020288 [Chaenocephalus aceratus]